MHAHLDIPFFTNGHYFFEEIFKILAKLIFINSIIQSQTLIVSAANSNGILLR